MKDHTRVYLEGMGYDVTDWIECEIQGDQCLGTATDVHHIEARGMGGTKRSEHIDNLMGCCRWCHNEYGDVSELIPFLQQIHSKRVELRGRAGGIVDRPHE